MTDKASKQAYDPATYRSHTRHGLTTDVFSSNIPHRAPLLCYIAGIECPITAADVSYGVWKIPEANITMFPDPQLQRFGAEDRVPVALFYLDEYIDQNKPQWRLLFEGEIVGWSYVNTAGSRSIQFSCVMNMAMWTQLFLFYMTSLSSVASTLAQTKTDKAATGQALAVPGFSLFRRGLLIPDEKKQKKPSADDYIKRPYDLAYNVVRSLISNKVPEKQRSVPGINFFARWSRREQFHNRWVAIPFLEEPQTADGKDISVPGIFPVLRAAQSLQAVKAVENYVAEKYSGGSIYTILKQVLDTTLMEMTMLPTAPCVRTRASDGVILGEPRFKTAGQKIATAKKETLTSARAALVAARTSSVITPALTTALSNAGVSYTLGDSVTSNLIEEAIKNIDKKLAVMLDTGPEDSKEPARLGNYFIKPQMLFGLPPNCNVIFPSMTPQISYQENYVTQPTRLYFQDDSLMQFQGMATAKPDLKQTLLVALSRAYPPEVDCKWQAHMTKGQGAKSGRNLLVWPEEFFKGPVTARYPAPPWLLFLASQYQADGIKSRTKTGTTNEKSTKPEGTKYCESRGGKKELNDSLTDQDVYGLYAQYEYFRHRFAARNGAVSCAFNPYVVPGFPLAIFDDFQSRLHVMGYLMNVTQQFTSRSVGTSLNFGYGRTLHEFLDLLANEIETGGAVADRKNLAMAAAPAEPIKEIRDVTQHFYKAEQFYQTLFHRRQTTRAVFEYRELIAMIKGDGSLEDIKIEGVNEETIAKTKTELTAAKKLLEGLKNSPTYDRHRFVSGDLDDTKSEAIRDAIDLANGARYGFNYEEVVGSLHLDDFILRLEARIERLNNPKVEHNLSDVLKREFVPKPGAEPYFDSYDAAMRYCARPICTLQEYIDFIRGVREGPQDDFAYQGDKSTILVGGVDTPSARYYARIRKLIGASANFKPTDAQRGFTDAPAAVNPKDEPNFPELRAQWEKNLLAYRRNVYTTAEVQR